MIIEADIIQANLDNARKLLYEIVKTSNIVFKEDDICNSSLPDNTYDIIISFDVLEHLSNPQQALKHMYRVLKPGGIAIHKYNQFFVIKGGHSACTLDFLWGHVGLNDDDFLKYLARIRPNESESSKAFFCHELNRMTQQNLKDFSVNAGFKIIGYLPYIKGQSVKMLTHKILEDCRRNYSDITIEDLTANLISIILKKSE